MTKSNDKKVVDNKKKTIGNNFHFRSACAASVKLLGVFFLDFVFQVEKEYEGVT